MRTVARILLYTRMGTFVIALLGGLTLAFSIGAVAASRHHSSSNAVTRLAKKTAGLNTQMARSRPDVSVMHAFARSHAAGDTLPSQALATLQAFANAPGVPEDLLSGAPNVGAARNLLSGVGPSHSWSLYAVPTSKGLVCAVWTGNAAGSGCFQGFPPGSHALLANSMTEGARYLWGFLTADVKAVEVITNGDAVPAQFGNSAFFYSVPTAKETPTGVVLHLANGSTRTMSVASTAALR
jgi:hypothetical protein